MAGSSNFSSLRPPSARVASGRVGETLDQGAVSSKAQQLRVLVGPVAILWDIENCPVPGEVNPEDVAGNIRMALRVHPAVKGAVTMFSAYGDFNHFPRKLREGCQRTGVNLIDVPNGKKDASDKAILVDMFLFALDNPPPCTILLISGDVDFAPALHKLGQRGYTVVLAIPAGVGVSSALCNAGRFVWDWPSVARGEGLVPAKAFLAHAREDKLTDLNGYTMGASWLSSDDSDLPNEDEHHAYWRYTIGMRYNHLFAASGDSVKLPVPVAVAYGNTLPHNLNGLMMSQDSAQVSGSAVPGSQSLPLGQSFSMSQKSQASADNVCSNLCGKPLPVPVSSHSSQLQGYGENINSSNVEGASAGPWVQPGDIQGLKGQFVKLLKLNGGKLILVRIPSEYCKLFGRPLYLAEYGSPKLVHLIERMTDAFFIKGEGSRKTLHLKEGIRAPPRHRRARGNTYTVVKDGRDGGNTERHIYSQNIQQLGQDAFIEDRKKSELLMEDGDDSLEDTLLVQESEACSDDEKASDQHETTDGDIHESDQPEIVTDEYANAQDYVAEVRLEVFRQELQELLVSHACKIHLTRFLTLYQQRYSRDLDVSSFGVEELESLIEKVKDVAIVKEEQGTTRKFLVANCSAVAGNLI